MEIYRLPRSEPYSHNSCNYFIFLFSESRRSGLNFLSSHSQLNLNIQGYLQVLYERNYKYQLFIECGPKSGQKTCVSSAKIKRLPSNIGTEYWRDISNNFPEFLTKKIPDVRLETVRTSPTQDTETIQCAGPACN